MTRWDRFVAAGVIALACIGGAGQASALDPGGWIEPPRDPRCSETYDKPCGAPPGVHPCGQMIPEEPCRTVDRCWIEPWLCRESNDPADWPAPR